ncbi:MAG: hypothetical protein PHU25_00155 [Deltaproteobacteria bacterium]|nr:hypothetical protein [Deltaproteobacteria bacterium]
MGVRLHPHASERAAERGARETEIVLAVREGERFAAKHGRTRFVKSFPHAGSVRDRPCLEKQLEVIAVRDGLDWLVITVIVRYFR